jgi:hypothetical protein
MKKVYWRFVVWCAMGTTSPRLNAWGLSKLDTLRQKVG